MFLNVSHEPQSARAEDVGSLERSATWRALECRLRCLGALRCSAQSTLLRSDLLAEQAGALRACRRAASARPGPGPSSGRNAAKCALV